MSLLDYKSARPVGEVHPRGRPHAQDAALVRRLRASEKFANDARLSDAEIATIQAWVDGGAAEGDRRDLPKPPVFAEGWKLGTPDRVVDIGQDFAVTPGNDAYEHFIVPTNFKTACGFAPRRSGRAIATWCTMCTSTWCRTTSEIGSDLD